jgi:hypothetical protein
MLAHIDGRIDVEDIHRLIDGRWFGDPAEVIGIIELLRRVLGIHDVFPGDTAVTDE